MSQTTNPNANLIPILIYSVYRGKMPRDNETLTANNSSHQSTIGSLKRVKQKSEITPLVRSSFTNWFRTMSRYSMSRALSIGFLGQNQTDQTFRGAWGDWKHGTCFFRVGKNEEMPRPHEACYRYLYNSCTISLLQVWCEILELPQDNQKMWVWNSYITKQDDIGLLDAAKLKLYFYPFTVAESCGN